MTPRTLLRQRCWKALLYRPSHFQHLLQQSPQQQQHSTTNLTRQRSWEASLYRLRRCLAQPAQLAAPAQPTAPTTEQSEDCGGNLNLPCTRNPPCAQHANYERVQNQLRLERENERPTPGASTAQAFREGWAALAGLDLATELRHNVSTVRDVPRWFQGRVRQAYSLALNEWQRTRSEASWKLVVLIPRMLLRPTAEKGEAGKRIFF